MSDLINEEIIQEMMGDVSNSVSRYMSCIRINGCPILPPLIDERYRGELTHYRNLAILVEKKIRDRKQLKDNRHSVDSGVMIGASGSEPSWLRSYSLQSGNKEEFITPHSFDISKSKSSCGALCLHRSNSSDDACLKNFICDHDMWRYVSNCDEQLSTAWFDNKSEEFLSNFGPSNGPQTLLELHNSDPSHLSSEKITNNNSQIVPCNESQGKEENISEKTEKSLSNVRDAVTSLSVFYAKYCKDTDEQNCYARGINPSSAYRKNSIEVFNTFDFTSTTPGLKSNCGVYPPQLNTESNFQPTDGTFRNHTEDSMVQITEGEINGEMRMSEYAHLGNISTVSDRLTDLNCSFKCSDSKNHSPKENEICNTSNTRKESTSSSFGTSLYETSTVSQRSVCGKNSNNVHILPLHVPGNKLSNLKISCSSISLPLYPISLCAQELPKQKAEKPYNPVYYGGGNTENGGQETLNPSDVNCEIQRKWLSDNMTSTVSDDSGEELCENTVNEDSPHLDSSFVSQKHTIDVPLSESISISDVEFHSSSVATTIAPDTSEDANVLPNHSSTERENELTLPKLVRQNSYTLIAPSPILLAHAKANEKQEEKFSSEDDNKKHRLRNKNKSQEKGKAKADWNSKKGVKYVYAAPGKQNQIVVQNIKSVNAAKTKSNSAQRNKIASLPGSAVSSPVKVKLFHSSLDNIPIVTVRRFQELIDCQTNQIHDSIQANVLNGPEILCQKKTLSTRSSSLDLETLNQNPADRRLKCRSKSDLHEVKYKQSNALNSAHEERRVSKNDIELLYRETSFDPSRSRMSHELDMNYICGPRSTQDSQTNPDEIYSGSSVEICNSWNQNKIQETEAVPECNTFPISDSTVKQMLVQLQNQHRHLMVQLLDRQKKEQEALANKFLNEQREILQEIKLIPSPADVQSPSANSHGIGSCNIEKRSPSAPNETHTFGSAKSHRSSPLETLPFSGYSDHSRYSHNSETSSISHHCRELDIAPPSPVPHRAKSQISEEQIQNAATLINAAARGYLIRRLLRTEHVQEIINTISESVQCALQLQRECPLDITPSDVELHKRLIQQLTAACYSLHDTFFDLPIQEKMSIIANDRERRQNSSSRPTSARTSISAATQKYIQRKQQNRLSERPAPNSRRSWWRSKARACSAGSYEQSSSNSKQPIVVTSKQQQCNSRVPRRPWR